MDKSDNKNYKLAKFFSDFFKNFSKLFLSNLMFNILFFLFSGIIMLISYLLGQINIFICFLIIPIMMPFSAGLTDICRKLIIQQKFNPIKDFFKSVKENLLFFIIDGIILYIICIGLWVTFSFYRNHLDNGFTIVSLVFSVIVSVYFLFMQFIIPTMTVSVELSPKEIIKNAVVLTIAGFLNNCKTLISFLLMFSILFTIFQISGNFIISFVLIGILIILFLPIFCTYIVTFNSYQTVEKYVIKPYADKHADEKRQKEKETVVSEFDIEELYKLSQGNPNEFVFLNGRILKRSAIKKILENNDKNK